MSLPAALAADPALAALAADARPAFAADGRGALLWCNGAGARALGLDPAALAGPAPAVPTVAPQWARLYAALRPGGPARLEKLRFPNTLDAIACGCRLIAGEGGEPVLLMVALQPPRLLRRPQAPVPTTVLPPPVEAEVEVAAEPEPVPEPPAPRQTPVRFVFQTDAEGRFTQVSPDLAAAIAGAEWMGRRFVDIAAEARATGGEAAVAAFAGQSTWSGATVGWPDEAAGTLTEIVLSAAPVFDRHRAFQGFRGFGIARPPVPLPRPEEGAGPEAAEPDAVGEENQGETVPEAALGEAPETIVAAAAEADASAAPASEAEHSDHTPDVATAHHPDTPAPTTIAEPQPEPAPSPAESVGLLAETPPAEPDDAAASAVVEAPPEPVREILAEAELAEAEDGVPSPGDSIEVATDATGESLGLEMAGPLEDAPDGETAQGDADEKGAVEAAPPAESLAEAPVADGPETPAPQSEAESAVAAESGGAPEHAPEEAAEPAGIAEPAVIAASTPEAPPAAPADAAPLAAVVPIAPLREARTPVDPKVVPFYTARPPRPSLSPSDRQAFREIARALGARVDGEDAAVIGAAADQPPAEATPPVADAEAPASVPPRDDEAVALPPQTSEAAAPVAETVPPAPPEADAPVAEETPLVPPKEGTSLAQETSPLTPADVAEAAPPALADLPTLAETPEEDEAVAAPADRVPVDSAPADPASDDSERHAWVHDALGERISPAAGLAALREQLRAEDAAGRAVPERAHGHIEPDAGSDNAEAASEIAPFVEGSPFTETVPFAGAAPAAEPAAPPPDASVPPVPAPVEPAPAQAAARPLADPPPVDPSPVDPSPFRDLVNRLPIGVIVARGEEILFANRTLLGLLGHASVADLRRAGGLDGVFAGRDLAAAPPGGDILLTRADGGTIAVDGRIQSLQWEGEGALLISLRRAASKLDEAELKRAEDRAVQAVHRADELQAVLDTATDGVIILDAAGRIVGINRSAEALFGYEQEEVAGKDLLLLFAPESHRAAFDYLESLKQNGVASVLNDGREVTGRVRQGGLVPLYMTIGRLGEGGRFCAVLRDMTSFKKAESELTEARRKAEDASAQKSDFLAKVSHEIRTPLNAIVGFAEMMMDERFGPLGNERYRSYARDIQSSGGHVISLVDDLLDLSKIEAGRMDLTFASVDLNRVLREAVAAMQPQANRGRIIIRMALAEKLPNIVADGRSLRQIALNLLSNSVKFTPTAGQVIVSTTLSERGEAVLRVRDTGEGMSERELAIAMEPFRQVSTSGARGTGLGLPLTKALVEANRASFAIESSKSGGTMVEVVFPSTRVLAE